VFNDGTEVEVSGSGKNYARAAACVRAKKSPGQIARSYRKKGPPQAQPERNYYASTPRYPTFWY